MDEVSAGEESSGSQSGSDFLQQLFTRERLLDEPAKARA
jgi:hypothetical protein